MLSKGRHEEKRRRPTGSKGLPTNPSKEDASVADRGRTIFGSVGTWAAWGARIEGSSFMSSCYTLQNIQKQNGCRGITTTLRNQGIWSHGEWCLVCKKSAREVKVSQKQKTISKNIRKHLKIPCAIESKIDMEPSGEGIQLVLMAQPQQKKWKAQHGSFLEPPSPQQEPKPQQLPWE